MTSSCFLFQVQQLKEEAIRISTLPQSAYSDLVLEARGFSLAQHPLDEVSAMSNPQHSASRSNSATGTSVSSDAKYMDIDEKEGMETRKPDINSLARTSRHFRSSASDSVAETVEPDEEDSGVFNNSRLTTESVSDSDRSDDHDTQRGVFDYFHADTSSVASSRAQSSSASSFRTSSGFYDLGSPTELLNKEKNLESQEKNSKAYDDAFDVEVDIDEQIAKRGDLVGTKLGKDIELKTYSYQEGNEVKPSTSACDPYSKLREESVREYANERVRDKNSMTYNEAHSCDESDESDSLQAVVVHDDRKQSFNIHHNLYRPAGHGYRFENMDRDFNDEDSDDEVRFRTPPHDNRDSDPIPHTTYLGQKTLDPKQADTKSLEEDDLETDSIVFRSAQNYGTLRTYQSKKSRQRQVDSTIKFPGLKPSNTDDTSKSSSDGVKIEKTIQNRETKTGPPFGDPLSEKKLFQANERLLQFSNSSAMAINLPRGEPINAHHASLEEKGASSGESDKKEKRKKKKKKNRGEY